jgi:hypothetical protein
MSDYKVQAYGLNERVEDFKNDGTIESVNSFLEELISDAEALRDEQQEKLDGMPEGFQQGSSGEKIQERIEALDAFISELEGVDEPEFEPEEDDGDGEDEVTSENEEGQTEEDLADGFQEEIQAITLDVS